ncbi:hypothetical protein FQZ97_1131190 [compost metagenome]
MNLKVPTALATTSPLSSSTWASQKHIDCPARVARPCATSRPRPGLWNWVDMSMVMAASWKPECDSAALVMAPSSMVMSTPPWALPKLLVRSSRRSSTSFETPPSANSRRRPSRWLNATCWNSCEVSEAGSSSTSARAGVGVGQDMMDQFSLMLALLMMRA